MSPRIAHTIQARIFVDDKAAAPLTITNALTGTDSHPTYRVELDRFREHDVIRAEIKSFERAGKTRLDLLAAAFRVIRDQEVGNASA